LQVGIIKYVSPFPDSDHELDSLNGPTLINKHERFMSDKSVKAYKCLRSYISLVQKVPNEKGTHAHNNLQVMAYQSKLSSYLKPNIKSLITIHVLQGLRVFCVEGCDRVGRFVIN